MAKFKCIKAAVCRLTLFLLFVLVFTRTAAAGISAPRSSATFSPDGKHILVMVSPDPAADTTPEITFPDGRAMLIRDTFAKSGTYDASTLAPEWTVEWFALERDLCWSDDFRYVVCLNRRAMMNGGWAMAFYDKGKLLQTHDYKSLLTNLKTPIFLPYATWDWHSRWYEFLAVNSAGDRVNLSTARRQFSFFGWQFDLGLQEHYEFDITTGNILSKHVTGAWVPWAYLATILATPFVLYLILTQLIKRTILFYRRRRTRRGFPVS